MITHDPFTNATSREFDKNLGLHDAFVILDNYIFVQVHMYMCMSICNYNVIIKR